MTNLEVEAFLAIYKNRRISSAAEELYISQSSLSARLQTLEKELGQMKQKRIVETAKCFLSKYRQYNCRYIRFDVLVVDMPDFESVYHIENAFSEYV